MGTEQFCLRWNDFHSNITAAFSEIRDEDDFFDVTLVCDGDTVKAHKLVLSACSPLFRLMLKKASHPQPMIFLRGIRFPDMLAILNFMYNGEVNVNQEDLQMFLAAAEELSIKGLSQASSDNLAKKKPSGAPTQHQSTSQSMAVCAPPPSKRPRPAESPPGSEPSTPRSAKSQPADPEDEEEMTEPPQLSVKREFSLNKVVPPLPLTSREKGPGTDSDEETDMGNNLLDCLVQAQNFALQHGFEQNMSHLASQSQQLMAAGSGTGNDNKNLLQFLGQNNVSTAAANAVMMQRLLGTGYELHPLGSRKDDDPFGHMKVARSSKGWHCPQCIHISSTKGNLKSHILSGRHKTYTEKPFGCQYCDRSYGTKQSLQVHISTNHRAERDAEYQALSKSLGMKTFPEAQFYMKHDSYGGDSVMSPAAIQQLQHQLQAQAVQQASHSQDHQALHSQASHVQATLASLSTHPNLTIQASHPSGLMMGESLPSCRMEARGNMDNKVTVSQYMSASHAATIDDVSEDEDEEPQLAINMDAVNTSITTP